MGDSLKLIGISFQKVGAVNINIAVSYLICGIQIEDVPVSGTVRMISYVYCSIGVARNFVWGGPTIE